MVGFTVGRHSISWVCTLFSSGALFLFIALNRPLYNGNYNTLHRSAGARNPGKKCSFANTQVTGNLDLVIASFLATVH